MSKFVFKRAEVAKKTIDLSSIGVTVNDKLNDLNSVLCFHGSEITKALGYKSAYNSANITEYLNKMYTILIDNKLLTEEAIDTNISEFTESIFNRNKESYDDYVANIAKLAQ